MNEIPRTARPMPEGHNFVQIDEACRRFTSEWEAGGAPKIEDYLDGWEEPERSKLLYELLSIEVDHRKRRGDQPVREEHEARFWTSRNVVREVYERSIDLEDTVKMRPAGETLPMSSELSDISFHAEGGLGIVYAAQDRSLKRSLAVKFIHDRVASDPASQSRFLLEAEVTSRLEHPGVVPVHGLGQSPDGRLFYAMRFIDGETFEAAIDRYHQQAKEGWDPSKREVQFRELLERFVAVCKTIAYAHNRGIVHRDIKPANIMLGRYGQTIVVDWGLALPVERQGVFKQSGERTLMPSSGSDSNRVVAGTPEYMSPEQASGILDLSPASDIYSLGATLYKVLTGASPFAGPDCLSRVTRGEFSPPSKLNKKTPRPVEAVCLKAMSLLPQSRYSTAMELAGDVENYLADVPVSACRERLGSKLGRWSRQHRTAAQSLAGVLILLTVLGALAAAWMARQAQREGGLRAAAEQAQQSEHNLRAQGLQVSANFAARMLANQIDIRWRVLEREAADPQLHEFLQTINAEPLQEESWQPLQEWLDARHQQRYPNVACRCWFVQSRQGVQVARSPSHQQSGERYASLGANYAFRDYFHGGGRDYYKDRDFARPPLRGPHNSTAMESTNDGYLSVVLSVPIFGDPTDEPLGVLAMSIELGSFADLRADLPEGKNVLLVETRTYYLLRQQPEREERGEGLVLHHQDFRDLRQRESLPHIDDDVVQFMRQALPAWRDSDAGNNPDNLLPDNYRDPMSKNEQDLWLAAFAPVLVSSRPADQRETGWFVIVQQRQ